MAPKMETLKYPSTGEWIKQIMIQSCNGLLLSNIKDYTWLNGKNIIKLQNTDTKEYVLNDSTY